MAQEKISVNLEKISKKEYIEFLTRTDLGSQYPLERFHQRIEKLVVNTQISVVARNEDDMIVGVLFALSDYSYWLFITDLGVDREYLKMGIGTKLIDKALEEAGGEEDIIIFASVYKDAVPFYEKNGMKKSDLLMVKDKVQWTSFTVDKSFLEI